MPKIWLPDHAAKIEVDSGKDGECTVYDQRITLVLKAIPVPTGLQKEKN